MTFVDYIAQLGGFFGLGIGLSMLSCIELIYWLTIQLCKNIKNQQVTEKKDLGPPELDDEMAISAKPKRKQWAMRSGEESVNPSRASTPMAT